MIRLRHQTVYRFGAQRLAGDLTLRLEPQDGPGSIVTVSPHPIEQSDFRDLWGNAAMRVRLTSPFDEIRIEATSLLPLCPRPTSRLDLRPEAFACPPAQEASDPNGAIWRWAAQCLPDMSPNIGQIEKLCDLIRRDFAYDPATTRVAQPIAAIFTACRGACQDFASLAIAVLRARGMTCRFNLGYLVPDLENGPRAIACHAWFSAWFDEAGWIDFDPLASDAPRFLLATGAQHADIAPVSGTCTGEPTRQILQTHITIEALSD